MMKQPVLIPDIYTHRALFFCVHQFNLLPTRYIHMSWLKGLGVAVQTDLRKIWRKNSRAEKHCAALIIKTFCDGFIYDFSDAIRRVALMERTELTKLMAYAGLAINARFIRQTISGRHIKALSNAFGPDAYEFAATRASLLTGSRRFDVLPSHCTDEVQLPGHILASGRRCLEICLEGSPDPLARRFRLKFPQDMNWDFTPRSDPSDRMACQRIIQKIMKMEIHPQWHTALP